MNKGKGLFLTFEGPEASGKSSQIKLLKKYFIKKKVKYLITREPGGTKIAEQLRNIIGVGEGKVKKYGEPFIHAIKKHVEKNDIQKTVNEYRKSLLVLVLPSWRFFFVRICLIILLVTEYVGLYGP